MEADACSLESKGGAQLILQVALVGEVDSLWVIHEEDEGRWIDLRLGGIVNLRDFPTEHGRIMVAHSVTHHLVQLRGRNAHETHIRDVQHGFKQRFDMISGLC